MTTSAPVTLNVVNAAPVASVSGPANGLRGESRSFTVSATDKPEDVTAGFTYTIHWGDGSPNTTISSTLGSTVTHAFSVAGLVTVSVTATDQHGAISSVATTTIQVDAVQLRPNADNAALWDLVWGGTTGADQVELEQVDPTTIRVRELPLNGAPVNNVQDFAGITGRVIALASAGDDVLDARGLSTTQATLNGNAGNNTLYGGAAGDLLIGGSNGGEGQQGNNVIIAGNGNNTIYGNGVTGAEGSTGGNNLIVGGTARTRSTAPSARAKEGRHSVRRRRRGPEPDRRRRRRRHRSMPRKWSTAPKGATAASWSRAAPRSTSRRPAVGTERMDLDPHLRAEAGQHPRHRHRPDRLNGDNFLQAGVTVTDDGSLDELYSDTNGAAQLAAVRPAGRLAEPGKSRRDFDRFVGNPAIDALPGLKRAEQGYP